MAAKDAVKDLRRVLALLTQVAVDPEQTVDTLAGRLGVDRGEVERLAGLMGLCGLPPYTPDALVEIEIVDDRISLRHGPADALSVAPSLTLPETEALHGALALLGGRLGPEADASLASLVLKIDAQLAHAAEPPETDRTLSATPPAADSGVLGLLRTAAREGASVEIDHYSASAERLTGREVDPHGLVQHGGAWYLLAHCHLADAPRVFRVDRIKEARPSGHAFEPPDPAAVAARAAGLFNAIAPQERGTVRLEGMATRRLAERWPAYVSQRGDDGSVLVDVPYRDERWLVQELLPHVDEVEVLGPPSLIHAYWAALLSLGALYGSDHPEPAGA